jgi:hypothetical protein
MHYESNDHLQFLFGSKQAEALYIAESMWFATRLNVDDLFT